MSLVRFAESTARECLEHSLPRRWAHSQAVAAVAGSVSKELGRDDADVLVSFTGAGGKGGRHIEHGYWLAAIDMIQQLRPYAPRPRVCVVGPRENIFHCHPATEAYPDWTAFLTHELRRQP